jgi:hypothetical protein
LELRFASQRDRPRNLGKPKQRLERHLDEHDQAIVEILQAIRQLMAPPEPKPKRKIGFL